MSYILDALRKADAQRERDPGRGIHAQSVPPLAPAPAAGLAPRHWLWVGLAFFALFLAGGAWRLSAPEPAPPALAPVSARVSQSVSIAAPANEVLPAAPAPTREVPKLVAASPIPAAAVPVAAPVVASGRVLSVDELPAEIQRELPKLAISGGVYSETAAQRMLIVNGQVFNEGALLGTGLVLEQIRAKTAVLSYRGYRYALSY